MGDIDITVQSILPADEPQGRFCLKVSPGVTVESLLRDLCREAHIPLKNEYCLRIRGIEVLSRYETLSKAGLQNGALLHWTSEDVKTKQFCKCSLFWFLALISFIIGVAGITAICFIRYKESEPITDYAIVFDAGSTHTSMFIYKWEGSKFNGTALAIQEGEKCDAKGPGISHYTKQPSDAGKSLENCLQVAKGIIPSQQHSGTPVYLGATAGMRLLNTTNPSVADAILMAVRETFAKSGFMFSTPTKAVRIISGLDEGSFSWVTGNYVTNTFDVIRPGLNGIPAQTIVTSIGALDLGGASTQITFIPEKGTVIPEGFNRNLHLYGHDHNVYTHSYLCYGVKEMTNTVLAALVKENVNKTVIEHPCLPVGFNQTETYNTIFDSPCVSGSAGQESFGSPIIIQDNIELDQNLTFVGEGNQTQCDSLLKSSLFNFTNCPYSTCSFNGVYQPKISGTFYAFSAFYYVSAVLNLTKSSPSYNHTQFTDAMNHICSMDWKELEDLPLKGKSKEDLAWYCLRSVYINNLLFNGYKFTDQEWPQIMFVDKIFDTEVGWTLGFVLNESDKYPVDYPEVTMYTVTFALLIALFSVFIIISVGLFLQGRKTRGSSFNTNSEYDRVGSYGAI